MEEFNKETKNQKKMVCVDPHDIPIMSIVDAELMASMPKEITASTGMDALTHAIESLISSKANMFSDTLAKDAVKIIIKNKSVATRLRPFWFK